MMWSVVGDHLWVYWRGRLIYKRRSPKGGHGMIFDPFGFPWMPADLDYARGSSGILSESNQ